MTRPNYDPTLPDQWHQMHTSDGQLTMLVSIAGCRGTIVFRDRDLIDLKKHVDTAIAQRALKETK